MMSNKWAFSLTSLITILALAFVVTPAMADDFDTTLSYDEAENVDGREIDVTIAFAHEVTLAKVQGLSIKVTVVKEDFTTMVYTVMGADATENDPISDVMQKDMNPSVPGGQYDGKNFTFKIRSAAIPRSMPEGDSPVIGATRVYVMVPAGVSALDPAHKATEMSKEAKPLDIPLRTVAMMQDRDTPAVVSIQRLRPGTQQVVSAFEEGVLDNKPFDIRFVFTEKPHDFKLGTIAVSNGTASNLIAGTPFAWHGGRTGTDATPPNEPIQGQATRPHPIEGRYNHDGVLTALFGDTDDPADELYNPLVGVPEGLDEVKVPLPTGPDGMYYHYRATITPHQKSANFKLNISINEFHDNDSPRNYYYPDQVDRKPNGREQLRLDVKGAARNLTAGYKVRIPHDIRIPGGGYLVIAQNATGSEVVVPPGSKKDAPKATERTPVQMIYNVIEAPTLPNLATAFQSGVVLDVQSQHNLKVSEVMWGEDVSLNPSSNSQYIELYNSGADYVTVKDADHTPDVNEQLTLIFYAPNEFGAIQARGADGSLPAGITDRIGTLDAKGAYWSPAAKGQSGRSGKTEGEETLGRGDVVPSVPIVSMYRAMVPGEGDLPVLMDGQMAASWMSSQGPKSANFKPLAIGIRHGTPGAATDATTTPADTAAEAKAKADAAAAAAKKAESTGTVPQDGQIYVSEVMFAGGGTLPQWIEISNGSRTEEVNLSGWTLTVNNAVADADVSVGPTIMFKIPDGTKIMPSAQNESPSTLLVVTEIGRNNIPAASGQVLNLWQAGQTELILAGVTKRRYSLLSDMAFEIVLAPPAPTATKLAATATAAQKAAAKAADATAMLAHTAATDMAGNLGADGAATWALPMSDEGGRSSIIRRHVPVSIGPAEPEDGSMMESWALASDTSFAQETHVRAASYYGAMNDVGTPGFRAGGALPVELSHFRPVRDKATGQVVITWSTQSELNNAGFFIKRSQQRDGEFKVINAAMVPGAGTTSEKQFYTYTDGTAQPNVVYYYQIEDVSLDGNRQTLTHGTRLRGHIGAAGKLTATWGELKSSNE